MQKFRISLLVFVVMISIILVAGCSKTYFTGFDPQSHFDYPNSNVIPLGKVAGEASSSALFSFPFLDSNLKEKAIRNALEQKPDADILINYMQFQKRTDILFIHTLTLRVEGTAAKMEIGMQKLK
jgi:hypothetical protein